MINIMEDQLSVAKTFETHLRRAHRYWDENPSAVDLPKIQPGTLNNASELVKGIEERIAELQRIENTGKGTSSEVSGICPHDG
jgi:hypothetical protein